MKSYLQSKIWWRLFLILVFCGLILIACSSSGDSTLPEGCDGVTWGSGIQIEQRGREYIAVIQGDYPDSCSTACGHEQAVSGNEININLFSSRPDDVACAGALVPFTTEVTLDTAGLDPGEYTVTLNVDQASTTFTLE